MNKYLSLLNLSWQNGFVYRTSVLMWRLRQFLATLMALTIWTVIFTDSASFGTYNQSQMITYIFIVAFFQNIILASILNGLADTIYSGKITHELLKPVNIFIYLGIQDVADKAKNVAFLVVETILLLLIFKPSIIVPDLTIGLAVFVMVILAALLNFGISLLFGSLGFWSPETWGPRFLFFMMIEFTAGRLFPLDILPEILQKIVFLTPFPYLSFVQTQMFLGNLSWSEVGTHFVVIVSWIGLFAVVNYFIWKRGLKNYSATGQ